MIRHLTAKPQAIKIFQWLIDNVESLFPEDSDSDYLLSLVDAEDAHSKLQQSYRWGWVYPELANALCDAGESLGGIPYTKAAIHAETQHSFRIINEWQKDGQTFYEYLSTSKMSKKAYSADIENINRYYIEKYQIGIPDHRGNEYYNNIAKEVLAR